MEQLEVGTRLRETPGQNPGHRPIQSQPRRGVASRGVMAAIAGLDRATVPRGDCDPGAPA